jgi:hypothetical protein
MKLVKNPSCHLFQPTLKGKAANSVPLESYRNVSLGKVVVNGSTFSIHLFLIGDGKVGPTNYMTNDHLKVIAAAMNAAKVLPSKCGLHKDTETGILRWYYLKEMSAFNFIADDGTNETKTYLKNTQRDMNGRTAKSFLTAIWSVLVEMAFEPVTSWEMEYHEECIKIGAHTGSMNAELMQSIAETIVHSSLIVAECAGTKNTILTNKPTIAIEVSRGLELDMWLQDAVELCHVEFKRLFTDGKEEPYPEHTWHRLDYAVEMSPMNYHWAFVNLLHDSALATREALRLTKLELNQFYFHLSNHLTATGQRKFDVWCNIRINESIYVSSVLS